MLAYQISPLRYPGGKSRALEQIVPLIPEFAEYREPFVGGTVFFWTKQNRQGRFWINDIHPDLAAFYTTLRDRPYELIQRILAIRPMVMKHPREMFYWLRDRKHPGSAIDRAVRFYILNRISFSGMTEAGGVSFDSVHRHFTIPVILRLIPCSKVLQGVQITDVDYEPVVLAPGDDVFIFLDPPYYLEDQSRLYGRSGKLHMQFDHDRFAEVMRRCPHKWLITYNNHPYIRQLFDGYEQREWTLLYSMGTWCTTSRQGSELFISNYPMPCPPRQLTLEELF